MNLRALAAVSLTFLAACATPTPVFFDPLKPDAGFVRRWMLLGPFDTTNAAVATPEFGDEAAAGGCESWHYEGVWFDEIEIVPAR